MTAGGTYVVAVAHEDVIDAYLWGRATAKRHGLTLLAKTPARPGTDPPVCGAILLAAERRVAVDARWELRRGGASVLGTFHDYRDALLALVGRDDIATLPTRVAAAGCGHDGWVAGCPVCENEAVLAGEIIARAERPEERFEVYALRHLSSCRSLDGAATALRTHEQDGDVGPYLLLDRKTGWMGRYEDAADAELPDDGPLASRNADARPSLRLVPEEER